MLKQSRQPLPRYSAYIFDLDGTIYLGDTLLPDAAATIARLRTDGSKVLFLSNNPTRTRAQYAAKLTALGIPTTPEAVINSSYVMVRWLCAEAPGSRIFVIGEQPLCDELAAAGFDLATDAGGVEFVIASFDRTFTYRKLQIAFDAIRAGARFVATNPDRYCPTPTGGEPDAAAIIAAIEACTAHPVEVVVGKPSPIMARTVANMLQLPPEQCLIVGDRLETDIAMGRAAGMTTVLTLTGATDRRTLIDASIQPDYVIESLDELITQKE